MACSEEKGLEYNFQNMSTVEPATPAENGEWKEVDRIKIKKGTGTPIIIEQLEGPLEGQNMEPTDAILLGTISLDMRRKVQLSLHGQEWGIARPNRIEQNSNQYRLHTRQSVWLLTIIERDPPEFVE